MRVIALVVVVLLLVIAAAYVTQIHCEDVRWVEGLDGEPLAQCYG